MSRSPEILYRIRDVAKDFPVTGGVFRRKIGSVRAVNGVSLEIPRGETVGVLGESGCGKTTLGRILALLESPTDGTLEYNDGDGSWADLRQGALGGRLEFRRRVQMIFQDPYSSFSPRQRVGRGLEEILSVHGVAVERRRERISEACDTVRVTENLLRRYPHELSGGQRQRLAIARCLTLRPELVIADEVVSALDVSIQAQVINVLKRVKSQFGVTFVFISHDVGITQYFSDRIAVMYLGDLVELLPAREFHRAAQHPYTRALISAVPVLDQRQRPERIVLRGEVPSPMNRPAGCPFSTRCPEAMDICTTTKPPLVPLGEQHSDHLVACHHSSSSDPKD